MTETAGGGGALCAAATEQEAAIVSALMRLFQARELRTDIEGSPGSPAEDTLICAKGGARSCLSPIEAVASDRSRGINSRSSPSPATAPPLPHECQTTL